MNAVSPTPVLSILIPTYKHIDGLARIMHFLTNLPQSKCEVIIYDNSPDNESKKYVESWTNINNRINLKYRLNNPITSAPTNWNNLIQDADGEYILLFHNGEFPATDDFFQTLINQLEQFKPDIAITECIISDTNIQSIRKHMPNWLKKITIAYFPSYLFHRNIIGPTSVFIAKKEIYTKFDPNLKWLLDVDSYYQTIKKSKKMVIMNNLAVVSVSDKTETLTKDLGTQINQIENIEKEYLNSITNDSLWLKNNLSFFEKCIKLTEKVSWYLLLKAYSFINKIYDKKRIINQYPLIKFILEHKW